MTDKKMESILREFRLVNPILESDGGGEYPDTYRFNEDDIKELVGLLKAD